MNRLDDQYAGIRDDLLRTVWQYRPALMHAQWARDAVQARRETSFPGAEQPAFNVVVNTTVALEAQVNLLLKENQIPARQSVIQRWQDAARLLRTGTVESDAAAQDIAAECMERGHYQLLVRSRNKLIHAELATEIIDGEGRRIEEDSVERIVQDLRLGAARLELTQPAFPGMLQTVAATEWAFGVMRRMTLLIHQLRDRVVDDEWLRVLR